MKLLLDQGLPRSAASHLRAASIEAVHTGEIGLGTAADSAILQWARDDGRIVVTFDADFHALLALSGADAPSVVRIRIQGLDGEACAQLLMRVLGQCADDLERGAVVTVQPGRIRVRRLPLLR
jgi:predicted nuclease of predicted toxin-antitoxin system